MRNLNVVILALVAAPLLGGCYGRVRGGGAYYTPAPRAYVATQPGYVQPTYVAPQPQAQVVYDDVVYTQPPVSVEAYPYVVYNGQPTYYVEGRWYRRGGSGWVVYNSEPGYLSSRRPAWQGRPGGGYQPPPAYGPQPYSPPPTYRPGYTTTAPPAYRSGGGYVGGGGSSAPPAVRATVTTAPPAH
ncbi:hypothetical protein BH09MYX1_BH09MYX1_19790 [soil metagenome]